MQWALDAMVTSALNFSKIKNMSIIDYPIKEFRREVKKYYGIEYALILRGMDSANNPEETPMGEKNHFQWWDLEYTDQSKRLAECINPDFLWFDTQSMDKERMQDKYHECELKAVLQINGLMEKFMKRRLKWLRWQLKDFAYVTVKFFPQMIAYRFKKLIGRQA